MTDASATRRPSTPCTRSRGSTTAAASLPILHVPTWWWYVIAVSRTYARVASGVSSDGPGYRSSRPTRESVGGPDPAAEVDGGDEGVEVGLAREDVRVERDGILRRRPGEAKRAAAQRAHHPAEQGEAVLRPVHPRLVHRDHEVDRLDVGDRQPRARAPEEVGLARREAWGGGPNLSIGAEDHGGEQVVVQVLARPRQVCDDVDPERPQTVCRPDPREEEELRRADRPSVQDHLPGLHALDAAVLRPLHADAAGALEQQAARERAGDHSRFAFASTGRMYAAAVLWRTPSRCSTA